MEEVFYSQGLHFECQKCSACCRYEPGYVFLSIVDLIKLTDFFNTSREEIIKKYCRIIDTGYSKRISLIEKNNFDCVFWSGGGCDIYKIRPFQCQSYPFWENHLRSREDWDGLKSTCPGVGKGRIYSKEEIQDYIIKRRREPLIILGEEVRTKDLI